MPYDKEEIDALAKRYPNADIEVLHAEHIRTEAIIAMKRYDEKREKWWE